MSWLPLRYGQTKPPPGAQVDWGNPLNRNLLGWWPFLQRGSPILRDIVGGFDGVLTNIDEIDAWVGSLLGGALEFGGTNELVIIDSRLDFRGFAGFTGSAMVRYDSSGSAEHVVFSSWQASGEFGGAMLRLEPSDDTVEAFIRTTVPSTIGGTFSDLVLTPNQEHLIVMSFDGEVLTASLDGVMSATSYPHSGTLGNGSAGATHFGNSPHTGGDLLTGALSDVRFWSRGLVPKEHGLLRTDPQGAYLPRHIWVPVSAVANMTCVIEAEGAAQGARAVLESRSAILEGGAEAVGETTVLMSRSAVLEAESSAHGARTVLESRSGTLEAESAAAGVRSVLESRTAVLEAEAATQGIRSVLEARSIIIEGEAEVHGDLELLGAILNMTCIIEAEGSMAGARSVVESLTAVIEAEASTEAARTLLQSLTAVIEAEGATQGARGIIESRTVTLEAESSSSVLAVLASAFRNIISRVVEITRVHAADVKIKQSETGDAEITRIVEEDAKI